jgi:mRNA interferase MazF
MLLGRTISMATAPTVLPARGEIWLINFDPATGAEIRKLRPAIVISLDSIGRLPLRLVVPITDWKDRYSGFPWFTRLPAHPRNGLSKDSGADSFQVKSVSLFRFDRRLGSVTKSQIDEISTAIALCVGAP